MLLLLGAPGLIVVVFYCPQSKFVHSRLPIEMNNLIESNRVGVSGGREDGGMVPGWMR